MWFRNLQLYRITRPLDLNAETLETKLQENAFRPCGPIEISTAGWSSPLGRGHEALVHATNGYLMICARKEEKILPSQVVNEQVAEKVAEIEDQQMRKVRRKEKEEIKNNVLTELMPRAFTRSQRTYAYLDLKEGWLIVDAASGKRAEELSVLLRKALGSLPIVQPRSLETPATVMTRWVAEGDVPGDYTLDDECELRAPGDEGGIVRARRQDLSSPEIFNHIEAGKEVVKLALTWDERMSFVLDDEFAIKRLRFLDIVQEQAEEIDAEDPAAQFDADFAIMSMEINKLLPRLFEVFGGENKEAINDDPEAASPLPA